MLEENIKTDYGEVLKYKHLILYHKGRYIVYIDDDNDIDWKTTDGYDNDKLTLSKKDEFNEVKNEIDSVECIPCNFNDEKVIINFKRQVGEALIRAFEKDFENARKMIKNAREYIISRNIQQSRFMYLTSSGITTTVFLLLGIILWFIRDPLTYYIGDTAFILLMCFIAGSLGAFLSIIQRLGNSNLDYNAMPKLHYLEGFSRIIAGTISAFLIALCIKSGILLPIFSKVESTKLAMILGGLVAGASERFAPSIIKKIDGAGNNKGK